MSLMSWLQFVLYFLALFLLVRTSEAHHLRVNMSPLRRKIEPDPTRSHYILTEPGVGYRLRG